MASMAAFTKAETPEKAGAVALPRVVSQRSLPAPPPPSAFDWDDRDPSAAFAEILDRFFHANLAARHQWTFARRVDEGLFRLVHSSGGGARQADATGPQGADQMDALRQLRPHQTSAEERCCETCIEPLPQDKRFDGEEWQLWPFNVISQSFLLTQQWWNNATTGVPGSFGTASRSWWSSSDGNCWTWCLRRISSMTNPKVLKRTVGNGRRESGRRARNFAVDVERHWRGQKPRAPRSSRPANRWRSLRARWCIATG